MISQDAQLKVQIVLAHMVSLKELVAAGMRSPTLLMKSLEKAPKEQREAVVEVDKQIRKLITQSEKAFALNMIHNGSNSTVGTGPLSPTSPRTTTTNNSNAIASPMSPPNSSNVVSSGTGSSPNLSVLFRDAVLGTCDLPCPIGHERIPRPGTTGLLQGNDKPLRALLAQNRALCEGLCELFEPKNMEDFSMDERMLDRLSFVHMMWVQQHPLDYVAAAVDNSRIQGLASNSQYKRSLEGNSSYLLMLNLSLKYPPETWTPLLQLRDGCIDVIRNTRHVLDVEMDAAKVSCQTFSSVQRVCNVLDALVSSLSFLSIHSTPQQISDVLFERISNALMEIQHVAHDHGDVLKSKKVCAALEDCCSHTIDYLKECVESLIGLG